MTFIYGAEGVIGFMINGISYLYRKNLFGDVTEIYNETRQLVGKYSYTAFGECTVEVDVGQIATKNPIRYRSYYYDEEINLYYLKTRYYDPEIGRFITIDDISYLDSEAINGLNLTYCGNNPVMNVDPKGSSFWSAIKNFFINTVKFFVGLSLVLIGAVITVASIALSMVPGSGMLTQTGFPIMMYGGFVLSSVFDSQINADMDAINWNPFNNNETSVINSTKVSFYRGVPVFKITGKGGSMSLGGIFFDTGHNIETLKHERGHSTQLFQMGLMQYLIQIGIPSLWKNDDDSPWELSASILGGASIPSGFLAKQKDAEIYFALAKIPVINIATVIWFLFY